MQISLNDARFFCEKISQIVRGQPEHEQNLEEVRRYFRAYLHCWKSTTEFVRKEKGLDGRDFGRWVEEKWLKLRQQPISTHDLATWNDLRNTRDDDFHTWLIKVEREIAGGLYPIVMFQPGGKESFRRELISCCERGLVLAEWLIQDYQKVP